MKAPHKASLSRLKYPLALCTSRIMTSSPICLEILPQQPQQYAVEEAEEVSAKGGGL
ncbi:hypothetical protein BT69DRAFT_1279116, partial [Atractiella rhizophila]